MRFFAGSALALSLVGATSCITEKVAGRNWEGPRSNSSEFITPKRAIHERHMGWVLLQCRGHRDASLSDCLVLVESPPGWGFGEAALSLQPSLRARDIDGKSFTPLEGQTIHFPIQFCPPEKKEKCSAMMAERRIFTKKIDTIYKNIESRGIVEKQFVLVKKFKYRK